MAKRRVERERGRREATADMYEDLSEGEKEDTVSDLFTLGESNRGLLPKIGSVETMEAWVSQQKGKKLYLVLKSLHGLRRGKNMMLGRDSDTGGQVKYVVKLERALGSMLGVYRVDLLTRQVSAPDVDWSYGEPTEMLPRRNSGGLTDEMGKSSRAYSIHIPFGPRNKYLPKESLWPYVPEFIDGALNHILQMSEVLGEQIGSGHPVWSVAIHGHYANAGDAAALLSGALNVPMLFTDHSLGRDRLEQLSRQGRLSKDEINATYKIMHRIEAEELALDASEIVITSTRQEIEEQWCLYGGFDLVLECKLRARIRRNVSCYGRFMPRMVVIPLAPGLEFHHIVPHDGDMDGETEGNEDQPMPQDPPIWTEIIPFFTNPCKSMILALARPDPKKNLTTLVKAFGECRPLRELANLTLIMGNRDDVDEMSSTSASVLLSILKLIDKYDLYGQVAYPKHHKQSDVPDIYRLAAKTKPPNAKSFIKGVIVTPLENIEEALKGFVWDFEKGDFHDRVDLFSHFNTVFIKTRKDLHVENNFLEFDPAFPREAESSELLAAEQGLQIIHLPNINTHQESDLELLNKLVMDFKVPPSLRFSLLKRLRFARAFSSLAARQQYTCICPYALVVLVQACGNTDGLDSFFDAEPELVSLLSYSDTVSEKIRSLSLLSLVALCLDWSRQPSVLIAVTSGGHHGILSSLMHKAIDSIVSNSSKRSVVFAEALSSLVTVLVSSSSGCSAIREAGFIPRLLPLLKDTDPQHLHLVSMAVHDLEAFMGYNNPAAALFRDLGGLDDTISQLKVEKSYVDDGSKQRCTSTELDSSESIQVDAGVSSKLYNMHPLYSGALENISTHKVERHVGFSLLGVGKTIRSLVVLFVVLFSLLINAIGQVPLPQPEHYKVVWRWVPSYCNSLGGRPCLPSYNSYSDFTLHGVWGASATNDEISCSVPPNKDKKYKAPVEYKSKYLEYWPSLDGEEDFLWIHEWNTHGHCFFKTTHKYMIFAHNAVNEISSALRGSTILDAVRHIVQDPSGGPIKVKPRGILYAIKTSLEGHLDVLVSCNQNKNGAQQLHEIYFCVSTDLKPKLRNCIQSISNCGGEVEFPLPPKPLPFAPLLKKAKQQQKTSLPTPQPLAKKRFTWQSQQQQQTTLQIPQQKQLLIRKGKEPLQEPQPHEPLPTPLPTRQQQQQKKQQHQKKQQQTRGHPLLMKEPVLPRPPKWELPLLPTLFTTTVLVIAVLCLWWL